MKYFCTLILALLLSGTAIYAAETVPPKVFLLKECINIAIENNTTIKASEEDKLKALADYRVATAQRLLFVDMNFKTDGYTKTNLPISYKKAYEVIPYLPTPNNYIMKYVFDEAQPKPSPIIDALTRDYDLGVTIGVSGTISIYNEKKARNQALAKTNVGVSKIQNKKAISDVIYNVKNAYYSYIMAKEMVVLREKLVKSNKDRLRITEILYKNAQRSVLDISKAKYDYQNSQLDLQKAINIERAARNELFRNLGVEDQGLDFALEEFNEFPDIFCSLEQFHKLAELNYPDLQLLKMQSELYRVRVELEKAGHYPEVDFQLGGGYRNARIDFTSFKRNFTPDNWKSYFGLNFIARLPLFSSGMVTGRVDSAKAEYNKTLYKEKDAIISLRALVENQYTTLQEMKKQIEMTKLMKENADKHWLMAKKTYESGATTQLELHDAMMSFANAEMSYQKAKYDYLVTLAKISSIVGQGEDTLCKK